YSIHVADRSPAELREAQDGLPAPLPGLVDAAPQPPTAGDGADAAVVQPPMPYGVYYTGWASEDSFAGCAYLVVRPQGNILVDSPRFNPVLARRLEAMGGVKYMFLTHRDDVGDHEVQNKVGGGGLYNLGAGTERGPERAPATPGTPGGAGSRGGAPSAGGATAGGAAGGGGARGPVGAASSASNGGGGGGGAGGDGGASALYLKNVLLKFLEAHLSGKAAERDMLLPAVATLLQASQEEYAVLNKILRATAPPSRQMLAVLGLRR
ncbi:hypothetical protein TSOC_009466, partial [Tetrabaena socialis]